MTALVTARNLTSAAFRCPGEAAADPLCDGAGMGADASAAAASWRSSHDAMSPPSQSPGAEDAAEPPSCAITASSGWLACAALEGLSDFVCLLAVPGCVRRLAVADSGSPAAGRPSSEARPVVAPLPLLLLTLQACHVSSVGLASN